MKINQKAQILKWTDIPADTPIPLIERRKVIGEQAMVSDVLLKKGCFVEGHSHTNEQFALVMSGKVRFCLGRPEDSDRSEVIMGTGEILLLPANVFHSAEALEDTRIFDVFAPACMETGIDRQGKR